MGIGAGDYRDITWKLLDAHDIDVFVAVLDELDELDEDELLRSLIPAKESGNSDAYIGALCVSNKAEYRDRLNERLDSRFQIMNLLLIRTTQTRYGRFSKAALVPL